MAPPQHLPFNEAPQVYPVPPGGPPGHVLMMNSFAPPPFHPQPEQLEIHPGTHQQHFPSSQEGQMSPHALPSQVPHSPIQMMPPPLQISQHMPPPPGHMAPMEQPALVPPEMHSAQQISQISSSPPRGSFTPQMDLYDHMANMVSIWHSYLLFQSMSQEMLISLSFCYCRVLAELEQFPNLQCIWYVYAFYQKCSHTVHIS